MSFPTIQDGSPGRFEFSAAQRIVFGAGCSGEAADLASGFGRRVLLVVGRSGLHAKALIQSLEQRGLSVSRFTVAEEPTVELISSGIAQGLDASCEVVIALGGGSVLDAGKAIAALIPNPGPPLDYVEIVGKGFPLSQRPLPCMAIPTTAGTGSEVTRNAVLSVPEERIKVSLRSHAMLPALALVDPELTRTLPAALTISTGMDALTQLIEPFVSRKANPFSDAFCREGLPRVAQSLREACRSAENMVARADMSLASLCGGLALANAGLGAVHGLAAALGGMFSAPHGALCASLLHATCTANVRELVKECATHPALARFQSAAILLTGDAKAELDDGLTWLAALARDLEVPPLRRLGVSSEEFEEVAQAALRTSSMKGNPAAFDVKALTSILEAAW